MDTNYFTFGDCPRPKKSKPSDDSVSHWAHLPSLVIHSVFSLLSETDRRNASSVCKHWRQNGFHPKWYSAVNFKIERNNPEKAQFFIKTFGKSVSDAKVKLYTLSYECVEEFIALLKLLKENNNLKSILIEPTHCRFEMPSKSNKSNEDVLWNVLRLLTPCLDRLKKFSIGCIEDLSHHLDIILKNLDPNKITHLGLASVKDDPVHYQPSYINPDLISSFCNLQVLSIDYDEISDNILSKLDSAEELERLVVHLHGIKKNHPGTTNNAWKNFCIKHPKCKLRLTVIHAFNDIENLHETVMRPSMPLSHLKVFFCEKVNLDVIQNLSNYANTLRSIMWIDSLSNNDSSWIFAKPIFDESPDPFVLTAWLCKHLEEFVLYGYKYWEDNLVAIGRLRSDTLKKFEIVDSDIIHHPHDIEDNFLDISDEIKKAWRPIKQTELHPVICSPNDGDSDEYLLPIVLADLY